MQELGVLFLGHGDGQLGVLGFLEHAPSAGVLQGFVHPVPERYQQSPAEQLLITQGQLGPVVRNIVKKYAL